MVSIAETESAVRKEEYATPTIKPTALLLEAVMQDFSKKIPIDGAPTEIAPEMSTEGCFEKRSD